MPEQSRNYLPKRDGKLKVAFPESVCYSRYLKNGLKKLFSIYYVTVFENLKSQSEKNGVFPNMWQFVMGIPTNF